MYEQHPAIPIRRGGRSMTIHADCGDTSASPALLRTLLSLSLSIPLVHFSPKHSDLNFSSSSISLHPLPQPWVTPSLNSSPSAQLHAIRDLVLQAICQKDKLRVQHATSHQLAGVVQMA